jgi:hypothetical protein
VRQSPLEGGVSRRARRSPLEGGVSPRAGRNPLEGAFAWATAGATTAWAVPWVRVYVRGAFCFCFLQVLSRVPPVFRGPSGLSPTVAPEHLRVCRPGSRRC